MAKNCDLDSVKCFRCYLEYKEHIHRILFKDVSSEKGSVFIKFEAILSKFNELSEEKVSFGTHKFRIVKRMGLEDIVNKDVLIGNALKIRIFCKNMFKLSSNPKQNLSRKALIFMDIIDNQLSPFPKRFNWKLVSSKMRSKGYLDFNTNRCRAHFHLILFLFIEYLMNGNQLALKEDSFSLKDIHLFRRMESMNFKRFMSANTHRLIENQKEVKKTVECLLTEVSSL